MGVYRAPPVLWNPRSEKSSLNSEIEVSFGLNAESERDRVGLSPIQIAISFRANRPAS